MQFNKAEVLLLLEDAMKAGFSVAEPYIDSGYAFAKIALEGKLKQLQGCWNTVLDSFETTS